MKRLALISLLLLSLFNVSLGIVYGCSCTGAKGGWCCGTTCVANANGSCTCSGRCANEQ